MTRSDRVRQWAAMLFILAVAAGVATCGPAPPPGPGEVIVPSAAVGPAIIMANITVTEIELPRLVCAVAQRGAQDPAISCVPKIPGLFEEPPR